MSVKLAKAPVTPIRQRTQYTCTLNKGIDWDKAPLGELPDGVVARLYGVSRPVVCNARNRRGIPPFKATFLTAEGEPAHSYPEALIDLYWHEQGIPHEFQVAIGPHMADWVVDGSLVVEYAGFIESRAFGDRYKARLKTKVAFYESEGWKVQVIYPQELNKFRPEGAPKISKDIITGGINWSDQPFGEMTDTALAERLGVSQSTVTRWRCIFGVPSFQPPEREWSTVPLGKEPDPAIATRLGVSKQTVRRARISRNIPSYRSRRHAT